MRVSLKLYKSTQQDFLALDRLVLFFGEGIKEENYNLEEWAMIVVVIYRRTNLICICIYTTAEVEVEIPTMLDANFELTDFQKKE